MVTIYIGKSAAGKDTFSKKMVNCGVKPIVSYTTRPMREGEAEGVEYNFVSRYEFESMIMDGKLIEYRSYNTKVNGKQDIWYYGTPVVDINDGDYVAILDIKGAKDFIRYYGQENCSLVYVYADDQVREERAQRRGSFDKTEWDRRLSDDNNKFSWDNLKGLVNDLNTKLTILINNRDDGRVTMCKLLPDPI